MAELSQQDRLAAIGAIQDPSRRALLEFISGSAEPVARDDAAAALGIPLTTAGQHLDRLVEAGLLEFEFTKRTGRTGPGSGRPAKVYRGTGSEISATWPERHYDLMGDVLAGAIEDADQSGRDIRSSLTDAARTRGRRLGADQGSLAAVLTNCGYEPHDEGDGVTRLVNCPFHRLAASHTDVICQANVALLEGAADGAGDSEHDIRFTPAEGHCCVSVVARG